MRRIHLFEFNDQPWFPDTFRRMQTDYLQFISTLTSGHRNLVPLFQRALQHAGTSQVVDLCSGGTGPWLRLGPQLEKAGSPVSITLTDMYPNPAAVQKWAGTSRRGLRYLAEPVDALKVPPDLKGMRTFFQGFHHFKPDQARTILQDAAEARAAIGVFEASLMPPLGLLLLLLAPFTTIFSYIVLTPFFKPRTLTRFLWTYLLPVVPVATCWDGVISLLRVYSPRELKELTASIRAGDYVWEIGQASTGTPVFLFTYLVGYPV